MNPGAHENTINPVTEKDRPPVPRSLSLAFGALMLLALVVYLWDFDAFQFGYNPDSGDYTLLAHAILKGPTYALHYSVAFPEPSHFPIGYPLLLIPFVLFAPGDFGLPAWLSLTATLASGAILFWGWRTLAPGYSDRWRIAVTAMFLLAPTTVAYSRQVLSEAIFTTFLLIAIFLTTRLVADPRSQRLWLAFSISAFFMIFTRSIGLACLACLAFFFLVTFLRQASKRRALLRGATLFTVTFLALAGAVVALTPVTPSNLVPATYLSWYGVPIPVATPPNSVAVFSPSEGTTTPSPVASDEIPRALNVNPKVISQHIHRDLRRMLTLTGGGDAEMALAAQLNAPWLLALPGTIVMALLALGNVRWWNDTRRRTGITVFQSIALVYLAICLLWAGGGDRLFYPIQPQLYFAALLGVYTVWQILLRAGGRVVPSLNHSRLRQLAVGGLAVIACSWLFFALYRDLTLRTSYEAWGDLSRRTEWIAANLPPDAVVLSDWPVRDYLVTGHDMILPEKSMRDADTLARFLEGHGVTHILIALDNTLEIEGIAPYNERIFASRATLRELMAQGVLVQTHSDPFPVLVLTVVP